MRVRSLLITLAALAAVLGVTSRPATAQTACPSTSRYVPGAASLSLSASQVAAGGAVVVSGRCCVPNSTVGIEFQSAPVSLGTVQTGPDGGFSTTVKIPANATPGPHSIVAFGAGCNVSAAVNVLGATLERTPGGANLPRTGGANLPRTGGVSTIPFAIAGLLLVVIGVFTVLAARRKRTAAAAQ